MSFHVCDSKFIEYLDNFNWVSKFLGVIGFGMKNLLEI